MKWMTALVLGRDPRLRCCRLCLGGQDGAWLHQLGGMGHRSSARTDRRGCCSRSRCSLARRWHSDCSSTGTAAERPRLTDRVPVIRVTAMPARPQSLWRRVRRLADEPDGARRRERGIARGSRQGGAGRGGRASASRAHRASATKSRVYVELLESGRTSLTYQAEAIARERHGDAETRVAWGRFTFVALDENDRPREIAGQEESNG